MNNVRFFVLLLFVTLFTISAHAQTNSDDDNLSLNSGTIDNQFEYEYIKRGPIIFKTPIMQKIYHEIDTPPPIVI